MAIDADLSAGLLDDKEAQHRRRELEEESSFFGSMDGASKFVRGDAIAGLIILAVNIFGGIVIGATRHNMPLSEAADVFTKLSVGDGLVSQIPALIVSLSAALLVSKGGTRGATEKARDREGGPQSACWISARFVGRGLAHVHFGRHAGTADVSLRVSRRYHGFCRLRGPQATRQGTR
jgi:flagellar biosynthesis component FlhA